jgi:hypothetical protein
MLVNSLVAVQLAASQEGPSSMELVNILPPSSEEHSLAVLLLATKERAHPRSSWTELFCLNHSEKFVALYCTCITRIQNSSRWKAQVHQPYEHLYKIMVQKYYGECN